MTPWFAAATGSVIAASLWIYSPHPQLAFPAIAIGRVPCGSDNCGSQVDRQGAPSLTMNSGEPMAPSHNSAKPAGSGTPSQGRTAASGLTFSYVVRQAADGDFALTASVTGKHPITNWRLAFVLPGDHIKYVFGVHWQPAGSDGGTASPFTGPAGQHGGGPWDSGGGYGNQGDPGAGQGSGAGSRGGAPEEYGVTFTVIASGMAPVPADCSYDGAPCTFHELSGD